LTRKRAPVFRARIFCTLRTWAVCCRTTCARLRNKSRTARAALGSIYPSGHTPKRSKGANQRASEWSSVYFRPLYCCIAAGLARWTRYSASINPSTHQYQLYVDSTTRPFISAW
jgi:hypothetical protein